MTEPEAMECPTWAALRDATNRINETVRAVEHARQMHEEACACFYEAHVAHFGKPSKNFDSFRRAGF